MESTCLTKICKWGAIFLVVLFLLSLFVPFGELVFGFIWHLLAGGFMHLWASVPYMVPSLSTLVGFAVLIILSVCALQILLAKFAKSKRESGFRWKPKWTLSLVGLLLAAFGTACTTIGLAHHATWLAREDAVGLLDGRGPIHRNISNCRRLITAMRIFSSDHGGNYPKHLEDLVKEDILDQESFSKINRMIGRDGLHVPWVFLPGLTDASPGDLPLIIGSCPVGNDLYIVGKNDSSVGVVKRENFEEIMTRYREFMGIERDGKAASASQ
ncbi:hypothetical protein DES53_109102 [Roseimicrobium gellanilyticum]|uniref:Uncharacterized protein n=2 Tax=Roseimicrobium gellanilyticum TaxID=748857 RepID=A0A366HD78_9BACT|nr:hypothetical protein DES53_109102 [Roseimicrobium gellanilyticum]